METNNNSATEGKTPETDTTTETTDTATTTEPQQYTCIECEKTGEMKEFRVRHLGALSALLSAENRGNQVGAAEKVVITPEIAEKHATCGPCAEKIRTESGVPFFPLETTLAYTRQFQQGGGAATAAPVDPESQVLVACCSCNQEFKRADVVIIGRWGAKLIANRILGREGGLATDREVNQMLLNNTGIGEGAEKCPVVCQECVDVARPALVQKMAEQKFVQLMSDEERKKQFGFQLKLMPLMVAIRKAREYEARGAAQAAVEQAARDAEDARLAKKTTLSAGFKDFLGSSASKKNPKGGGKGGRDTGRGERGGGNHGRWHDDG